MDFTGTSPVSNSNFNAPAAIARAAVLYVFRTLVDENIPLNGGCLDPVEIRIPEGSGAYAVNEANEVVRVGGVLYTIKDGIVYDAKELLADVAKMVKDSKR